MALTKITNDLLDLGSDTGALGLPKGTEAQRPSNPVEGTLRHNSEIDETKLETYNGTEWRKINAKTFPLVYPYTMSYLAVAGGGSGNKGFINNTGTTGGGGGAGGLSTSTAFVNQAGQTLNITIGAGAAWTAVQDTSASGSPTNVSGFISLSLNGGGGGGMQSRAGGDGGSGGGAHGGLGGLETVVGLGTSGQGNNGGPGNPTNYQPAGGGGGYSSTGSTSTGGAGLNSTITGSSVEYAKGGNGGSGTTNGSAGEANTGNGGNGSGGLSSNIGSNGGSGVMILRIPTASYSGTTTGNPTVTTDGTDTILTYTSSGTYTA